MDSFRKLVASAALIAAVVVAIYASAKDNDDEPDSEDSQEETRVIVTCECPWCRAPLTVKMSRNY